MLLSSLGMSYRELHVSMCGCGWCGITWICMSSKTCLAIGLHSYWNKLRRHIAGCNRHVNIFRYDQNVFGHWTATSTCTNGNSSSNVLTLGNISAILGIYSTHAGAMMHYKRQSISNIMKLCTCKICIHKRRQKSWWGPCHWDFEQPTKRASLPPFFWIQMKPSTYFEPMKSFFVQHRNNPM